MIQSASLIMTTKSGYGNKDGRWKGQNQGGRGRNQTT